LKSKRSVAVDLKAMKVASFSRRTKWAYPIPMFILDCNYVRDNERYVSYIFDWKFSRISLVEKVDFSVGSNVNIVKSTFALPKHPLKSRFQWMRYENRHKYSRLSMSLHVIFSVPIEIFAIVTRREWIQMQSLRDTRRPLLFC
jgi:hypothetical protein